MIQQGVQLANSALELYHAFTGLRSRARRTNKKGANRDTVSGVVKFQRTVTLSGGIASVDLDDVMDCEVIQELGRIYRFYRFDHVKVHMPAPDWTTAVNVAVAYSPTPFATSSGWDTLESQYMINIGANNTVGKTLSVPNGAMNAQHRWFVTTGDASDPGAEQVGQLLFAAASSSPEILKIQMEIGYSFKSLQDPTTIGPVLREWALKANSQDQPNKQTPCETKLSTPQGSDVDREEHTTVECIHCCTFKQP